MGSDPFATFKERQREMWSTFAPTATFTTPVAAQLVRFAGVSPGEAVLDIGTGTGVAAITAARAGARVSAIDLTPALLDFARENAQIAGVPVDFTEGDAERLPYPDASFDVVLSQFGHMFAPRPELAVAEMRRVLRPAGRVAFTTWPPDLLVGRMFAFLGRAVPPPPGVAPPTLWGEEAVIAERLNGKFDSPEFERGVMMVPALSVQHFRVFMERSIGPFQKVVESMAGSPQLDALRRELESLVGEYYDANLVRQEYLLTRATAR
ncbi:MAG TPA: class I SAM-dependent methyltransferase [Candidatus Cybelea sp.]|jgi:SAM-dependent methyltransferase